MAKRMPHTFEVEPSPDAEQAFDQMMDLLADGLAGVYIRRARREVAERLGVDEASLDRERDQAELDTKPGAWLGQLEVA
ncbi:MAG: hypothetical protein H6740_28610 [Alphaproteobacteria bacterium]|nr:hypothetical protein [Alphaproteobacteria bacterium]